MAKSVSSLLIAADEGGGILSVAGEAWSPLRKRALREKLRAGELEALEFQASVYKRGPNRNFVRFRDEDLAAFARSFEGVPFLRNHDLMDIGARDGTVVASAMVGSEFIQTIRLTTERGMRDFLEGVMDRFSIGWYFADVECSICRSSWTKCGHWPGREYDGERCELVFVSPEGKETSAVNAPAVPGTHVIEQLSQLKERKMGKEAEGILLPDGSKVEVKPVAQVQGQAQEQAGGEEVTAAQAQALLEQAQQVMAQIEMRNVEQMIAESGLSPAGKGIVTMACRGQDRTYAAQFIEAQRVLEAEQWNRQVVRGMRAITESMMHTPEDRVQSALNWIFGLREEETPPPSMRSIRDIYQAITGDHNWYGVFNPEWSQLAAASTSTLAGMVVNALNKVVRMHYDNTITYRWYEPIVEVVAHDGSTHDVSMIMVDGLANLPTVLEGAAYTEAVVGDSKETMSFAKRGHYVGITLEAIRKSDIQRIQAIPRQQVLAAIRTRSAAIAGIFTMNSAVGPTLADDSTALFHANHGNLDTTAFSGAAWAAARQRIWLQTIPGTSNPLGLWPSFCLVPIELYDTALTEFGYGSGDVGKPNSGGTAQVVNPYALSRAGDPRPIPIAVPEWTDATDWAYIVDPRLHPVIHMAFANAPQGGAHPMPEIFETASETSGLMFTNDTLPVKIRDWWGYGVNTYIGVGKNNVAGS